MSDPGSNPGGRFWDVVVLMFRRVFYSNRRMVCGNDIYAHHMAGEQLTTLQNGLTDTPSCLTHSVRRRSSVTVNPLQHERTVAGSVSIDIPSTAWCVATISTLIIWQGSRAQPSRTVQPTHIPP